MTLTDRIRARRRCEVQAAIAYGRGIGHLDADSAKAAAREEYPHDDELMAVALLRGWTDRQQRAQATSLAHRVEVGVVRMYEGECVPLDDVQEAAIDLYIEANMQASDRYTEGD